MTPRRYLQEREMVITASRTMNEMDGGHLAAETAHRLLVITQMNADCPRRRKNGASTCVAVYCWL